MNFFEKLDEIMKIASVTNAMLARGVNVDPSLISKLRNGSRKISLKGDLLFKISIYLAGHCGNEYQLIAIGQLANVNSVLLRKRENLIDFLHGWLSAENHEDFQSYAEKFLHKVDNFDNIKSQSETKVVSIIKEPVKEDFFVYYGEQGRINAAMDFIKIIISAPEPCNLTLSFDNGSKYYLDNINFESHLQEMITLAIKKGCSFVRVNPNNELLAQAFSSIERWLPAYMNGAIKSYYYPKVRDGIYKRNIIIGSNTAALISDSINNDGENLITYLTTSKRSIKIYQNESDEFIKMCKPLLNTYSNSETDDLLNCLEKFSNLNKDAIYKCTNLSDESTPVEIIEQAYLHYKSPNCKKVCNNLLMRKENRLNLLKKHSIYELIYLPPIKDVIEGIVPISFTKAISKDCMFYTPKQYKQHLKEILFLLNKYPNYHISYTRQSTISSVIYAKGEEDALIIKGENPFAIFELAEKKIASTFTDYLFALYKKQSENQTREHITEILESMISQL